MQVFTLYKITFIQKVKCKTKCKSFIIYMLRRNLKFYPYSVLTLSINLSSSAKGNIGKSVELTA